MRNIHSQPSEGNQIPPIPQGADAIRIPPQPHNAEAKARNAKAEKAQPGETAAPFTDDTLALNFAETHANRLRYVAPWNKWMDYDGNRWRRDDTLFVYDLVRKHCRQVSRKCNKQKVATAIASAKTVAAVATLARTDRRIAATVDQWDADPWALNTPAGVVDLRTGKIRPHRAEDYMAKITAAAPDHACQIETFKGFLNDITARDQDLIAFLQRMSGYALTGDTSEQALFFGYGTGKNGKTTFLNVLGDALGDYHRTAPVEMFTETKAERHTTEIARLQGARLVTATETEEGRRWAEAKIKALTGGEKLTARFMRQDNFEFVPAFKLIIAGNHKPSLRTVDEAIRRRFNLIPFTVKIEKRDPYMGEKLKAELQGIMHWMVQCCLAWQRIGLAPPTAVTKATAEYLSAEDSIAAWLQERTERAVGARASCTELFRDWKGWAEQNGEDASSQKTLTQKLEVRGLELKHTNKGNVFFGIRLNCSGPTNSYGHD